MLKLLTILISLSIWFQLSYSQEVIDIKIHADTIVTAKFKPEKLMDNKRIFLKMAYAKHEILNPKEAEKIKGRYIEKIQLVYTDYPKGDDMSVLNKKRILSLYMLVPELFDSTEVKWEIIKQTGATRANVHGYFHGFSITYRNKARWEFASDKKIYFENVLAGKEILADSTILKVLERNKDWDNMLIVSDFTGSMSPYIAELLLWYHLNIDKKKNQRFVFFNDGNMTPNEEKIIGKTGGIYFTEHNNIDSVLITAVRTIDNGAGGDPQENDVEALLFGMKKFPKYETVVLIADNTSDMRDFELIQDLSRPVKVILCGGKGTVNPQYLNLAYATGGSIHTIEEDIMNLVDLHEGQTVKIGDTEFIIRNGEFQLKQ